MTTAATTAWRPARAPVAAVLVAAKGPKCETTDTTTAPVRSKLLAEAGRMLESLGVPDPEARAIDFIGIMNGLLYDRLVGNGVRGTPVDAANVLRAWLVGVGARQ